MTLSTSLPAATSPLLCTDADLLVRAGGDFIALTPPWQVSAAGFDGAFLVDFPWVLTSASVDFEAGGVVPNQVVHLTRPVSSFAASGQILVIDSVAGGAITLRRLSADLNVGHAPAPVAGLTSVEFKVPTLMPQIEEASFDIKRRFAIDESRPGRGSASVYDLRDLRRATVLTVLLDRYIAESRTATGDFDRKVDRIRQQLHDTLGRVEVRWGQYGASQPTSTLFGCRLSR